MENYLKSGVLGVELIVKETCNGILVAMRRSEIDRTQFTAATAAVLRLARFNVKMFPQSDLMSDALEIASSTGLTLYDTIYLALAKREGAPILTLDRRQIDAAKKMRIEVV